jgi:hypothetical protein
LVAWLTPERLVFVDIADDESEWVGEQHLIRHLVTEGVDDIRCPPLSPLLLLVAR